MNIITLMIIDVLKDVLKELLLKLFLYSFNRLKEYIRNQNVKNMLKSARLVCLFLFYEMIFSLTSLPISDLISVYFPLLLL
jgi:hypothetical protein